ncbi:uncharacterized protein [Apostichopus japonicus]|uniref:uncharacterized protein n=1 Tax=Stichopus japonicus TaxID=307972 RepID=UPI003AB19905
MDSSSGLQLPFWNNANSKQNVDLFKGQFHQQFGFRTDMMSSLCRESGCAKSSAFTVIYLYTEWVWYPWTALVRLGRIEKPNIQVKGEVSCDVRHQCGGNSRRGELCYIWLKDMF